MPNQCDDCKTNAVDIARKTTGTPTAKLIAILEANGITAAATLAEIIGISERAVRKARNSGSGTQVPGGTTGPELQDRHGTTVPKTELQDRNSGSALACAGITTGATKESPTEINYSSSLVDAPQANILPFAEPVSKQRGSRLPETWELPDDWRQWAEINTQLGREGIALEADKFRDFWIAQPGVKGRKANWPATWRNWCRSAGSRRPYSPGRMSYDERKPEPKINVFDQLRAEGYR